MSTSKSWLGAALLVVLLVGSVSAEAAEELDFAEARSRLTYLVGTWNATTEYLDDLGNVVRKVQGSHEANWAIDGTVVEVKASVPELEVVTRLQFFHNVSEDRFYMTSVDAQGDLWVLSGDLGAELVLTSAPKKQPDGKQLVVRLTHHDIGEDSFATLMEYTENKGKSWQTGFRQYLTRR